MRRRTVLSMEQATALPHATQRFAQLGWRVIRIEATGEPGAAQPGDPNRYVGKKVADDDRHALFIPPNTGKEAIALNLKSAEGRAVLHRLVTALDADVFTCNTLPSRYKQLGIDYETLSAIKPDIIWASISALGHGVPTFAGYDPVVQAMSGLMDINGFKDGPPTLMGLPISDLKAGDEVYANVLLALLEKAETGRGRCIDVSMLQAAMSWLVQILPLVDMGADPSELSRTGNAHRRFVPTNVYPTRGNFVYMASGNNVQWQKLVAEPQFTALADERFATADGRYEHREEIYRRIGEATGRMEEADVKALFARLGIPHTSINTVSVAMEQPAIRDRLPTTTLPDGRTVRMTPPAVTVPGTATHLRFPPRYGEHTDAVLAEIGYGAADIATLRAQGAIA